MRRAVPAVVVGLVALAACGTHSAPDRLLLRYDAGADSAADAGDDAASGDAAGPYVGAPCIDDGQCDDGIACTYDSCDAALGRCVNVPDDTQCDDGLYCDGRERCVPGHGCEPGPVVTCTDGNACHIARCAEATRSCEYSPRDVDQDGDPDAHCPGGGDCDDLDPAVSSKHAEVCGNGVDDNCNGLIDENPCVAPQGETCDSAVRLNGAGTYALSTLANTKTFSTSCSVANPAAAQDAVATITVPPGPDVDLDVWATAAVEVAVAIQGACGDPTSELACGSGQGATSVRARARGVHPGTYAVVVTTQSPAAVELEVALLAPTSPPTNVDCATASPVQPGVPVTVSIIDPPADLPSACTAATGELTYTFTLSQPQDVRVYASTSRGSGAPIVGLRDPSCVAAADERSCRTTTALPVYARALPPGSYVVTVAATAPIDVSLDVELSPPSAAPADATCASPPPLGANARVSFDLANHEHAIADGCSTDGPQAAYDLTLAQASDVLLVERLPVGDRGALSLDAPACSAPLTCVTATTPLRAGRRNVPAGDYRAVVADENGLQGTLDGLVRATVAPTIIASGGADTCATAIDASGGGFFEGDTSSAVADYSNPCDSPTAPPGGAPDQVLALVLPQPQRVVLDMEGSTYTTTLDVRQGPDCPGTPVGNGCYVGFEAQRSFLDLELAAGTYWLIVDGYDGAPSPKGPWDLDVRILPP